MNGFNKLMEAIAADYPGLIFPPRFRPGEATFSFKTGHPLTYLLVVRKGQEVLISIKRGKSEREALRVHRDNLEFYLRDLLNRQKGQLQ